MAMEARKFDIDKSKSEDAQIVSGPEKTAEKPKSPEEIWSGKYWDRIKVENPDPKNAEAVKKDTERIISGQLEEAAKKGKLELSVLDKDFTDSDREKIFAYSEFAKRDKKYKVGPFKLDESGQKASAEISRERGRVIDFSKHEERISDLFNKDEKGIGAKKALAEMGAVLGEQFAGLKKKYEGLNLDPKKILTKANVKKIFGADSLKFWAGFATGSGVRLLAKWGIGASGGLFAAMGAGTLAGGSTEFVRTIISEKKRLKENPLSEDQVLAKAKEIGASNENIKKKLDEYLSLDILQTGYPEFGKIETFSGYKAELYQALRKEIKADSIDWKKVRSGVARGAIYGALGGVLGSTVSHFIFGAEDAKEIAKAAKEAGVSLSDEVKSQIQDEISDVYSKTHESALAEGIAGLEAKEFFTMADNGDSLTTMSRNLIHDYISQKQALGIEIALDKSQLIYAEDALKNLFEGKALNPGDELNLLGEQIKSAIEKAQLLTSAGKEHIKAEYASKIGDKTWGETLNYSSAFHGDNNFSERILKIASDEAAVAVNDAKESIAQELAYQEGSELYKDKAAVKAAEKATHSWLKDFLEIAGIGAAFKIRQYRERKMKKKEPVREYRNAEDFNGGNSDLKPEPKKKDEYVELKEEIQVGAEELESRAQEARNIKEDFLKFAKKYEREIEAEFKEGYLLDEFFYHEFYSQSRENLKYSSQDENFNEKALYYRKSIEKIEKMVKEWNDPKTKLLGDLYWSYYRLNGEHHSKEIGRYYLNLKPEKLSAVLQKAILDFGVSGAHLDMKVPRQGSANTFNRVDKMVIYFDKLEEKEVISALTKIYRDNKDSFDDTGIPPFTEQVKDLDGKIMMGIGFGEEPRIPEGSSRLSFGQLRMKALAMVYKEAKQAGVPIYDPKFDFDSSFRGACERFKIDPDRLARNSRTNTAEPYIDDGERGVSASDEYLDDFKKPEEKVEGKTESTAKETKEYFELDERLIDQPVGERASDEFNETQIERSKRLSKDPLYKFLRGEKLDIKPGWVSYIITGHRGGEWEKFDSFDELKSWYKNKLSPEEREKIKKQDREGKTRAVFMNIYPPLRNYLNNNEDLKNRFNSVVEKNISALFRERRGKIVSKNEENFEEIRGTEIGNEAPYLQGEEGGREEQNIDTNEEYRGSEIGNEAPYPAPKLNPDSGLLEYRSGVEKTPVPEIDFKGNLSERDTEKITNAAFGVEGSLRANLFEAARQKPKQQRNNSGGEGIVIRREGNNNTTNTGGGTPREISNHEMKDIYDRMSDEDINEERKRLQDEKNDQIKIIQDTFPKEEVKPGERDIRTVRIDGINSFYNPQLRIIDDIIRERNAKEKKRA